MQSFLQSVLLGWLEQTAWPMTPPQPYSAFHLLFAVLGTGLSALLARALARLMDEGLDGAECFYPLHSRDVRETCLSLCRRRDLLVSAGSDCHGSFQNTQIGQTKTDMADVSLELLGLT